MKLGGIHQTMNRLPQELQRPQCGFAAVCGSNARRQKSNFLPHAPLVSYDRNSKPVSFMGISRMAKSNKSILNRLAGKQLAFDGEFPFQRLGVLKEAAKAHGGTIQKGVTKETSYLVLPDSNANSPMEQKVLSLNGKGGKIDVIDDAQFTDMLQPTDDELTDLLRAGDSDSFKLLGLLAAGRPGSTSGNAATQKLLLQSKSFKGADLTRFALQNFDCRECDFTGAKFCQTHVSARNSNFSKVTGRNSGFYSIAGCRFANAELREVSFVGDLTGAVFDDASRRSEREVLLLHAKSQCLRRSARLALQTPAGVDHRPCSGG